MISGAGAAVLAAALLYLTGHLRPWMVIPINLVMSSFATLMWPADTASVTLLVPKQHYGRGMASCSWARALPQIAGLAGALYLVAIHLGNLALIDFGTYLFSVILMMLFVRIPDPATTADGRQARGSVWKEMRFRAGTIFARVLRPASSRSSWQ